MRFSFLADVTDSPGLLKPELVLALAHWEWYPVVLS